MYGKLKKIHFQKLLVLFDLLCGAFSLFALVVVTGRHSLIEFNNLSSSILYLLANILCIYVWGGYSWQIPNYSWAYKGRLLFASCTFLAIWAVVNFFMGADASALQNSRVIIISQLFFLILIFVVRILMFRRLLEALKSNYFLVVADQQSCIDFEEDVSKMELGDNFYYLCNLDVENTFIKNYCGNLLKIKEVVNRRDWAAIITSTGVLSCKDVSLFLMEKKFQGLSFYTISDYYEMNWLRLPIFAIDKSWFVISSGFLICHSMFWLRFKRIIDIFASLIMLILSAPLLIFAIFLIKLESKENILFIQERVGANGKVFKIYKLRTMCKEAETKGTGLWTQENDNRITKAGKYLRKFRIDELPQLFNIFKGDMSLIGPRPEAVGLVEIYQDKIPFYQVRHLVKPGVTGWAQVMYGYGNTVNHSVDKLEYDLYYIKNYSLLLDLNIVFKTIRVIFGKKGV